MIELTSRDKEMLKMWDEGETASHIGNHFGITRNAVMGRLNRLRQAGFVGYKTVKPPIHRISKKAVKADRAEIKEILAAKRKELKLKTGYSLMQLDFGMCRYPISGNRASEYRFCGKPISKRSYCTEHHELCWYPAGKRDRDTSSQFILKR